MKSVANESVPILTTIGDSINHAGNCDGNVRCAICGRRMCHRCSRVQAVGRVCMICSGCYSPENILLFND